MLNKKKFIVSHAPFWHNGSCIKERNINIMIATIPALIMGFMQFGMPVLGVICLSISSAMLWELAFNKVSKRAYSIADYDAAVIGLLFAMLLPATVPWWVVIVGTLVAVVIGKEIFGGIGSNAFNPVVLSLAIVTISWGKYLDFETMLVNYNFNFSAAYPLVSIKHAMRNALEHPELFNVQEVVSSFDLGALLMGKQIGGIGTTFGIGIIIGGLYLILRGFIRWEIVVSFLAGVFATALLFHLSDPTRFAGPAIHLCTGFTLFGAFFLATETSSSPVNFIPMLLFGALAGLMTVLIRNIGMHVDGVLYAILVANLANPLLDKIRPKAMGKVVEDE